METFNHMCTLPTEVLLNIFTYLPPKEAIKCRQVCHRWRDIVDIFCRSEFTWFKHCSHYYNDVFLIARRKSRVGMSWFNIYRSLSLWPMLSVASEVIDEFASASTVNEQIRNIQVLRDGVIGVHKASGIIYYDIETLEPCKRNHISGNYLQYTENDLIIVILSFNLHMFVARKINESPCAEPNKTLSNVKSYVLVDREVYYVTLSDEIYVCKLELDEITNTFLLQSDDVVMCMGYVNNRLYILTFKRTIYMIVNGYLVLVCCLDNDKNLLHELSKYNLLEQLDWRVYFQWMFVLRHSIPTGPLKDIVVVRKYGDVIFVGSKWGVLSIYYAPYINGELNLYITDPIKQYNLMDRPMITTSPIIQIDVMESEEGHTVVVAMPKKIVLLDFIHDVKGTVSPDLTYSDT